MPNDQDFIDFVVDQVENGPSFDSRNYGFKKLVELVNEQPYLEIRKEKTGSGSGGANIFVRLNQGNAARPGPPAR